MSIPSKLTVPKTPRFIFAPDPVANELYIICTKPLALIWFKQTIPAQLYIIEGPMQEKILRDAADFYRSHAAIHDPN